MNHLCLIGDKTQPSRKQPGATGCRTDVSVSSLVLEV
jgi:hypothetical protein